MKHTKKSLEITQKISNEMEGKTFHHHYHILYDLVNLFDIDHIVNYVEIGCYAGASACLVSQRKNTNIFSIDLGGPIPPEVALRNFAKFNVNGNKFQYIKGNSRDAKTFEKLKEHVSQVDVLFIDGDHSAFGVKSDFDLYSPLVKEGGYIVFDDYNDHRYSPNVKIAVDEIIKSIQNYEIIGTLPNIYGARPDSLKEGNCFIIKKVNHG
jgi:predicted O-methyltransferase YrrM